MTEENRLAAVREDAGKESIFDLFVEVVRFTLLSLLFIIPIRIFIAQPYIVSGAFMHPTFGTGEYLIVDQLSYRFDEPERGDVVIFRFPQDRSKYFIKRVIGLPGETVSSDGGAISITTDGGTRALAEPYLAGLTRPTSGAFSASLKNDEYFVMGDNRAASLDSRIFGAVPRSYIGGRAFVRLLPPTRTSLFPGFHDFDESVAVN